jgi:hypothetical protein
MDPMVYYLACRSPPIVTILSQINPVHITPFYFSEIDLILSFHLPPVLLCGLLLPTFSPKSYKREAHKYLPL